MPRKPLALAAALIALALQAPSAHADPALAGTFDVSGNPGEIATGPDGNVWFTLITSSAGKEFGKITPDGTVTEFDSPGDVQLKGITAGPDGNVWATGINSVVKIPPANPASAQKFTDNNIGGPSDITTGPDGNLWTASGGLVIMVPPGNPGGGDVPHASILSGTDPQGIAAGSDGKLWILDNNGDNSAIVRFSTNGTVVGTPISTSGALNQSRIAAGPPGQMLFTQSITTPQRVGRVDSSGNVQFTNMPNGLGDPIGVVFGNDGAYWIANFGASKIRRLTPDGVLTEPITLPAGARFLAKGANDTLWATLEQANKIARVTGVSAPPAPPVIAPPPLTSPPPASAVAALRRHVFTVSGRFVTMPVRCQGTTSCVGSITLRTAKAVSAKARKRKLKLGAARYSIAPGQTKRVKVKLSKKAVKLIRRHRTLKAVATIGGRSTKVTLKRKR